jgi:hypothetical protein
VTFETIAGSTLLIPVLFGCSSVGERSGAPAHAVATTHPDHAVPHEAVAYEYRAFDNEGRPVSEGTLGLQAPLAEGRRAYGSWNLRKVAPDGNAASVGPQEGRGPLTAELVGKSVTILLGRAVDDEVILAGTKGDRTITGEWRYYSEGGLTGRGRFEARELGSR